MRSTVVSLTLLGLSATQPLVSQRPDAASGPGSGAPPPAEMSKLEFLIGRWDNETEFLDRRGEVVRRIRLSDAMPGGEAGYPIRSALGGWMLEGGAGTDFGRSWYRYDAARGVYLLFASDFVGNLDVLEGHFEADSLVFTAARARPGSDGRSVRWRWIFSDITPKGYRIRQLMQEGGSGDWRLVNRQQMRRMPAEPPAWLGAPEEVPAVMRFLGAAGLGRRHPSAPQELEQWGRLAGIWIVDQEMRRRDSSWADAGKGLWVWRYTLEGFAVTDLWYQSADALPSYLEGFGRDYLLSGVRVFDAKSGTWRVAFVGNGAGRGPGADFSTFEASWDGDRMVMTGPPIEGIGMQRVVFFDFTADSFRWVSEYSQDQGKTWIAYMRLFAHRRR